MFDVENYFETELLKSLNYMVGKCECSYREGLWFSKEVGEESFVLGILVHSEEYKYVALTNLLLPSSMKRKGVSIEIISILAKLCKEIEHDLYIIQITNDNWKQGLLRHGCYLDNDGDIFVDVNVWISIHSVKNLRFEEFEGHMIQDSYIKTFKLIKNKCIDESIRVLKLWNFTIDILDDKGYIEAIRGVKNDECYFIKFSYNVIIEIANLIDENKFENYLKENQYIGIGWI